MYRQEAWKPEKKSNFAAEIISFTAKYHSSNAGPEVGTPGLKSVCLLPGDERIVRGQNSLAENIGNGGLIGDYAPSLDIGKKFYKLGEISLVWHAQVTSDVRFGCWGDMNA
ncbi:uncharacterized protein FOBCDRAFT_208185 [Fusarium oxysporum Fo47]|uniref:uncharacterized protein n=1 Tax=Fusarium oxysporum Fo47 TaxID=660027 RepID=UPI002869886E|nr:uncharacterized protein FOBCDRAFT_208185 [Fusarium oxysporum Fo47]QKD61504.2 hypothetical protein FOBCDRAFT_208185 [Fusarium oxysporum Fo47]